MDSVEPRTKPAELKRRIEETRKGRPFLEYRDGKGEQALYAPRFGGRVSVGRDQQADVSIDFDDEVSRLHCELERIGGNWVLADDGLSRNGTFVNGERVVGRRRLRSGDAIRAGSTTIVFHDPSASEGSGTAASSESFDSTTVTEAQRRVLVALCRPFREGREFATPASNAAIAEELFLSVSGVKAQLRGLFERFAVDALPQNRKRVRLAELAMRSGVVAPGDLEAD